MKTNRSLIASVVAAFLLLAGCSHGTSQSTMNAASPIAPTATSSAEPQRRDLASIKAEQAALSPADVLESLRRGNERFAAGKPQVRDMLYDQRTTADGQYPHAIILSCIDSRAPAEIIFDAGLGELFNARVAGNVANPDLVGSMEYACAVAGAKVVLVMGHTHCGAIKGACDNVELGNLTGLLQKIEPAVTSVRDVEPACNSKNHGVRRSRRRGQRANDGAAHPRDQPDPSRPGKARQDPNRRLHLRDLDTAKVTFLPPTNP